MRIASLALCLLALAASSAFAQPKLEGSVKIEGNWPQFRGPNASGRQSPDLALPAEIWPEKGYLSKVPMLPGHATPITVGARAYLSGERDKKLMTVCVDIRTGQTIWETEAPHKAFEDIHRIGSHAQSTPVANSQYVV